MESTSIDQLRYQNEARTRYKRKPLSEWPSPTGADVPIREAGCKIHIALRWAAAGPSVATERKDAVLVAVEASSSQIAAHLVKRGECSASLDEWVRVRQD